MSSATPEPSQPAPTSGGGQDPAGPYKLYGLTDEEIAVVEGRGESNVKSGGPRTVRASANRRNATVPETPTDDEEILE